MPPKTQFSFCARAISAALLLTLLSASVAEARRFRPRYKYYLDVSRAEEILAQIPLKPQLTDDQWKNIVGDRQTASITIQEGDNLWNLSKRAFGDPFLWRKLWEQNQGLANPHELDIGRVLEYYHQGPGDQVIRVPVVKLLPGGAGVGTDLDNDAVVNNDIKNRFRVSLKVISDEDVVGEISGSYSPSVALWDTEKIYARFKSPENIKSKDRFALARIEKSFAGKNFGGRSVDGKLVRVLGEAEVLRAQGKFFEIEVKSMSLPLRRGDLLVPVDKAVQWTAVISAPKGLRTRILAGEMEEYHTLGQGQLVVLDKGDKEGMKTGYLFRVVRDKDPVADSDKGVPPDYIGEIQVIHAGQLSSVGYIVRNSGPVFVGDLLLPASDFANPPPPIVQPHEMTEIP